MDIIKKRLIIFGFSVILTVLGIFFPKYESDIKEIKQQINNLKVDFVKEKEEKNG